MACEFEICVLYVPKQLIEARFRWVECQLTDIRGCRSKNELKRTLTKLPSTIEETYLRTLERIDSSDYDTAIRLFQCLCFSTAPLPFELLRLFLAAEIQTEVPNLDLDDCFENIEDVFTLCPSFLTVYEEDGESFLRLAHFSVKEFLLQNRSYSNASMLEQTSVSQTMTLACIGSLLRIGKLDKPTRELSLRDPSDAWHLRHGSDLSWICSSPLSPFVYTYSWDKSIEGFILRFLRDSLRWVSDISAIVVACTTLLSSPKALGLQLFSCNNQCSQAHHDLPPLVHFLAFWGNLALLKIMVQQGSIDVKEVRPSTNHIGCLVLPAWVHSTALHIAAAENAANMIQYLIHHNLAAVDQTDKNGDTALHLAAAWRKMSSAAALVHIKASKIQQNDQKRTPLMMYLRSNSRDITTEGLVLLGLGEGTYFDYKGATTLHVLARKRGVSTSTFKYCAEHGADINCQDDLGYTALRRAVTYLNIENVKSLLSLGCRAEEDLDRFGNTLIHCVCVLLCRLIAYPAPWLDEFGRPAFEAHVEQPADVTSTSLIETLNLLEERGIDPNTCNNSGQTPLEVWIIGWRCLGFDTVNPKSKMCPEYIKQHSLNDIAWELIGASHRTPDNAERQAWLWLIERTTNAKIAMIKGLGVDKKMPYERKEGYWV